MKRIPLTQNEFALVDNEDFKMISKHKWYCVRNKGNNYARRNVGVKPNRSSIEMHRVVLKCPNGMVIDHINGNSLDNRKKNLRVCTQAENTRNRIQRRSCKNKFKGITFHKHSKVWHAQICINYNNIYLGSFKNQKSAAIAYDAYAKRIHKQFARTNGILD